MPIGYQKDVDNNPQSQTSALFQYFLIQEQKNDITLTSDVSIDDEIINVSAGHGFTAADGEMITLWEDSIFEQARVVSVATNAIKIEIPVANNFTSSGCRIVRGNLNMNVNGSISPIDFLYKPYDSLIPIDISGAIITIQSGANVPDDGKFGGITALDLDSGLYFREINGKRVNLGNYTKNKDFKDRGAVVIYSDKAPAGTNGTDITFNIESIFGQVLRIDPRLNGQICANVRDDLSSLDGMTLSVIGSYTKGE